MVSGYCPCSFPAIHMCKKCGKKFCNNCFKDHVCATKDAAQPKVVKQTLPNGTESASVATYNKKPGNATKTK